MKKFIIKWSKELALFNGLLYFAIAIAGVAKLQQLFHFDNSQLMYLFSIGSAICYGTFSYKSFEFITLKPKTGWSWCFAILAPFAASSFLTAGIEGTMRLNLVGFNTAFTIGSLLFIFRTINFIDGAVKFPDRVSALYAAFQNLIHLTEHKKVFCILVALYTAIGYSLSTTDAIYPAILKIMGFFNPILGLTSITIAYISSIIGAIVGFPMFFYWTNRGMIQLLGAGIPDAKGMNMDPTDRYTYISLLLATPVILGSLGAATSSNAQIFGQLGLGADIVRVSSSVLFALCAAIPGLSTLLRVAKFKLPTKIFNQLGEKIE